MKLKGLFEIELKMQQVLLTGTTPWLYILYSYMQQNHEHLCLLALHIVLRRFSAVCHSVTIVYTKPVNLRKCIWPKFLSDVLTHSTDHYEYFIVVCMQAVTVLLNIRTLLYIYTVQQPDYTHCETSLGNPPLRYMCINCQGIIAIVKEEIPVLNRMDFSTVQSDKWFQNQQGSCQTVIWHRNLP